MAVFQQMLVRSQAPDVVSYNALVSACEKGEQRQAAVAVFQHSKDPNIISYNALISACANGEQWQAAVAVFQQMLARRQHPDVISYSALISPCMLLNYVVMVIYLVMRMCNFCHHVYQAGRANLLKMQYVIKAADAHPQRRLRAVAKAVCAKRRKTAQYGANIADTAAAVVQRADAVQLLRAFSFVVMLLNYVVMVIYIVMRLCNFCYHVYQAGRANLLKTLYEIKAADGGCGGCAARAAEAGRANSSCKTVQYGSKQLARCKYSGTGSDAHPQRRLRAVAKAVCAKRRRTAQYGANIADTAAAGAGVQRRAGWGRVRAPLF